jgi:hypothetical protein
MRNHLCTTGRGKERLKGVDDMVVYSTAVLLAAVFNVSTGIRVFTHDPASKMAQKFLTASTLLALWGVAEAVALFSPDQQTALFWTKISYVPFFALPLIIYHLAYSISGGRWKIPLFASNVVAVIFMALIFSDSFIQGISNSEYGYIPVYGGIFPYFVVAHTTMSALGLLLLYSERMKQKTLERVHHVDVMIGGFIISALLVWAFELILPALGWELPRIGSVFSMLGTAASKYAYMQSSAIIYPHLRKQITTRDALCGALCSLCTSFHAGRCESCSTGDTEKRSECRIYRCAQENNTNCLACENILTCTTFSEYKEMCPFQDQAKYLPSGVSYRIESASYEKARTIFRDRVIRGDFGLLVSREHPDIFFRKWDLEKIPVVWLSVKEENTWTISPGNLAKLTHVITNFIKELPVSCILFEGLEYLIIHNSFESVMKVVYSVDDEVTQKRCRVIVSYDPRALDEEGAAVLERELKSLPEGYAVE